MACFSSMLKYWVFLCNFLFFITGCIIIGFGAFMHFKMKTYFDFVDNTYVNSAIVFIVIGVLITFVAFFGCCGACTENSCMMYTFAFLMALILVAEIGVVVTALVFRADALAVISTAMKNGLTNYEPGNPKYQGVTDTWDVLQHDFQCCGVKSYRDWAPTSFSNEKDVPDSCCVKEQRGCGKGALVVTKPIHENGCLTQFVAWADDNIVVAAGVGVGMLVIQLATVLVSCFLGRKMAFRQNYV